MKKIKIIKNKDGVAFTLSSLIAMGVALTILVTFYYSISTNYVVQDNPETDLKLKSESLLESLVSLPGENLSLITEWQNPNFLSYLGFATTPTIEYGIIDIQTGKVLDGPYPKTKNSIGQTCFLADTKVIMSDESCKKIQEIVIGDIVKSYDEKNQKIVDKKVTQVFHHNANEMDDYYIIINHDLKVTPNHKFYMYDKWINAEDLKIGEFLQGPNSNFKLFSIEKIYQKEKTYNFEVEDTHNYFISLDQNNILAHNGYVNASFIWFDCDGLNPNTIVYFNATDSIPHDPSLAIYRWYVEGEEWAAQYDKPFFQANIVSIFGSPVINVTLKITDSQGDSDNITKKVVVNKLNVEYPNSKPWLLTGKDVNQKYGENTFTSYGNGYFINYTLSKFPDYLYEIKSEKGSNFQILDENKIKNVFINLDKDNKNDLYNDTKNWMDMSYYDYHITIWYDANDDASKERYEFGPNPYPNTDTMSTSRQIMIYRHPTTDINKIKEHIKYLDGKITISVFFGGSFS